MKPVLEETLTYLLRDMMKQKINALMKASVAKIVASVDAALSSMEAEISGSRFGGPGATGATKTAAAKAAERATEPIPDFDDLLAQIFDSLKKVLVEVIQDRLFAIVNEKAMAVLGKFDASTKAKMLAQYDASGATAISKMRGVSEEARVRMEKMSSVKSSMMAAALNAKSKYDGGTGFARKLNMWQATLTRPALDLKTDEKELTFLLTKIQELGGCAFTNETWRDSVSSWLAVLNLYKTMKAETSLSVLETIIADDKVAEAIGAAAAMVRMNGVMPASLLVKLNEGPATHIRINTYKYVRRIEKDLNMISAIQESQAALGAVAISVMTSIGVGFATFASGLVLELYRKKEMPSTNTFIALGVCFVAVFVCMSCIVTMFRRRQARQQQKLEDARSHEKNV